MKCPRCQHENSHTQKFCGECGARLTTACGACGASNSPEQKFCGECGSSLDAASTSRFASPKEYIPKHLAERILLSKDVLEGERKQVTVLFADLKGSMELVADRDPEEARKLLDPVLEKMIQAVHRYEGTVNQVMGDGIMALFGAPLALEDHAVRACYAALAMHAAIRSYSDELRRSQGLTVRIRAGLNSGEVVVRTIGSDLRMDYTAVGQTTHLAARMEQLSDPGVTLMTPATLQLAEGFVAVKSQGPVPVKGLADPVEVFELTGVGVARSRLEAAAARGLTKFVGRRAELTQINYPLEQAQVGRGQVVALVGEPGVGKSRLVWEFTRSHRSRDWVVLESTSMSYGKASAYRPVIDLLRSYFEIEDRDDTRRIREKATGKLLALDEALKPHLVPLLALLDVAVDDANWKPIDPAQKRVRILNACKHLILRESQVQPVLVVFEDLHWIDSETQALLDALVESLPTARVLLLVNFRPEYEPRWNSKTYYTQLRVDPLTGESAEEMLRTLLGTDPSLMPLAHLLIERTEGNPFYLEESVRALVETGELQGARGAFQLIATLASINVPATVQAILAARIDRLTPDDKHLLQAAAVIGKDVSYALLRAIVELSEDELRQHLSRLQAGEFLYEKTLFPDLEYTFKHALTHEVAYGSMLQERRKALHARIMASIERLHADRLIEQVERLAHHAAKGEAWEKALDYLHQSGSKAVERSAYRPAVTYLEQGLATLDRLPESRERRVRAIDLCFELRGALWAIGELTRVVAYVKKAEHLAHALEDPHQLGWAAVYTAHYLWIMGHPETALTSGVRAAEYAEQVGDVRMDLAARYYQGLARISLAQYRQAEETFAKLSVELEGPLAQERLRLTGYPVVHTAAYWAWSLGERGMFKEAIERCKDSSRVGEAFDHAYTLCFPYWHLGYIYALKGEPDAALRALDRAAVLARSIGASSLLPGVEWCRGYALVGRSEGLVILREAVPALEKFGVHYALAIVHLGQACALAGKMSEARSHGERALSLARERHQPGFEAYALRLLGEVAAASEPLDAPQAEARYQEALVLSDRLGMRPLLAHSHFGLGKLFRSTNKQEQAQSHFTSAIVMYREMEMQSWLEQAELEMT
jgi:class 3 adenylate cyclase/tetratricopeptide (TPR) repeat protein